MGRKDCCGRHRELPRRRCGGEVEDVPRATLVAFRRLAGGNGDDGTQNIDGLHFEMTDAFLESNSSFNFNYRCNSPRLAILVKVDHIGVGVGDSDLEGGQNPG